MPEENPTPNTQSDLNAQNTNGTTNSQDAPNSQSIDNNPIIDNTANTPADQPTPEAPATDLPQSEQPEPATPAPEPTTTPANLDDTPAPMASPIMKSTVRKPKNILLPIVIILAILALAGLGASIFAFIQTSNKDTEIARLRSELANQGVILPTTPDDDKTDQPTTTEPEITSAIRAKVLASVPTNLVISDAKSMNTTGEMIYSTNGYFDSAFSAGLDLSTNQPALTLNWDRIKEIYPTLTIDKTGTEEISDLGLSGKPTDMLLTGFGQAVGYEAIFFLMEDGTVEYIPLAKAVQQSNFKSYGKLSNVDNVIKFYSGSSCSKTGPGCGRQSLAQRADGNYYELYEAVKVTGNFDL